MISQRFIHFLLLLPFFCATNPQHVLLTTPLLHRQLPDNVSDTLQLFAKANDPVNSEQDERDFESTELAAHIRRCLLRRACRSLEATSLPPQF